MSLVNDMLNDLERRRSNKNLEIEKLSWLTAQSIRSNHGLRLLIISLAAIAALIAIGLLSAHAVVHKGAPIQKGAVVEPQNVERVTRKNGFSVSSTTEQSVNGELSISISLSEIVSYRIQKGHQQLTLVLKGLAGINVGSVKAESPMRSAQWEDNGGDLQLVMQFDGPIEESVRLNIEPKPELRLLVRPLIKSNETVSEQVDATGLQAHSSAKPQGDQKWATGTTSEAELPTYKDVTIKKPTALTLEQRDIRTAKKVRELLNLGRERQAEAYLERFLNQYPRAKESTRLLMALLIGRQQLDAAQQKIAWFDHKGITSPDLRSAQARIWLLQGKADRAVELLLIEKPSVYQNADYYALLALASQKARRYSLSAKTYQLLLSIDGAQGDWWAGLAIAQDLQGLTSLARNNYQQALVLPQTNRALRQYARERYLALAGSEPLSGNQ